MSVEITKLEHEEDTMYRIIDYDEDNSAQQVIVLTREELGDLHHLIDVQFMSENEDHEESMRQPTQEEIDNEMAWDDHKNKWSD